MNPLATIIISTILILSLACGQPNTGSCDCPEKQFEGRKADSTFHFSNGNTIILCGYKNPERYPTTFSEFVLAICGQDTVIGAWDATRSCRLNLENDTLFVDQMENLPTGENFTYQETIWSSEKMYFNNSKLVRQPTINQAIRKYNPEEIQSVLKTYARSKPGVDDSKMELANKLFIATISGDNTARQYFKTFENKFGMLDGAFAEEYHDLTTFLEEWDRK